MSYDQFDVKRIIGVCILAVAAIFALALSGKVVEGVDADEIVVIQDWYDGELHWYVTAGIKWQGFGQVTTYPKRAVYDFTCSEYKEGTSESQCTEGATDGRISIRFNDGGHGWVDGSIQYEMPLNDVNLTELHVRFGSRESIQKQLIETVVNKSVYMIGPLMSSRESFADKRNDLLRYAEDQIEGGVYQTTARDVRVKDELSGADKTVKLVEIVNGPDGRPLRQEQAQLTKFSIKPFNFSIKRLPYDVEVEGQIKQQQQITMQVQTAIAESRQAEQRAITVEQQGKAEAAKAKWDQEVIKAKFVTEAEQKLEVAKLGALAAEQNKRASILDGEGEATKRRLIMDADGGLNVKVQAYIETNKYYADAMKGYSGNWVPTVVMSGQNGSGSGSATPGSGAITLMEIMAAKAARDLGLDMGVSGASRTRQANQTTK